MKALMISCFDWYKTRLEPIRQILYNVGYDVIVLESDFDHLRKTQVERRFSECTYIHVPTYKRNFSLKRIRSHLTFGLYVDRYIKDIQPDFVYLQIPPNISARYCARYKKIYPDSKMVLDIVDLWPESIPFMGEKIINIFWFWKNWRNKCIRISDCVVTECRLYQKKLNIDAKNVHTLYLYKELSKDNYYTIKHEIIRKNGLNYKIKMAYLGSMNSILDMEGIAWVVRKLLQKGFEVEVHAVGDGENRDKFEKVLNDVGCRTFFYGFVFDEAEKIRILASCDYALNIMKDNVSVGLTTKSIDYLSYGLPLINNIKGDTWNLIEEYEIGINIDKNQDIELREFDRMKVLQIFNKFFSRESFRLKAEEIILQLVGGA